MDVSNLLNFYNTLFGIEIAIFGIISAVIFVFVQLLFSGYSYKHILHILSDRWLILYFIVSLIDLLMIAVASYYLSLPQTDLFPQVNFQTQLLIHPLYAFLCLALIFISVIFFTVAMIKDISYLNPRRALLLIAQDINPSDIKKFLWWKYPLEVPFQLRVNIPLYFVDLDVSEKAYKARIRREEKKRQAEIKRIESLIAKINAETLNIEDPYRPFRDMMVQFIKKADLSSLQEAARLLNESSDDFIEELPQDTKDWLPEKELALNYTKYLLEFLDTLMEIAGKEGLESAKRIILEASFKYTLKLFEYRRLGEVDKVSEWWQQVADNAIGNSTILFQNIMKYYREIGEKYFANLKESDEGEERETERLIDNLFRYIGWLGERLLIKHPFEEEPLFVNYSYSTEYDEYYNCLMAFEDNYTRDNPSLYPLVFFDALVVVMKRLVKVINQDERSNLDTNVFSIAYTFSSFAKNALKVGNTRGAALAALCLKETYQELKGKNLDKNAIDVLGLVVQIGMQAASIEQPERVDFMSGTLDKWAISFLSEVNEDIGGKVNEAYRRSTGENHDSAWSFVTELGQRMGTNFGFMFDPITREIYAEDDPRRR